MPESYDSGFYPRRRGLLEHLKQRKLSIMDDGFHDILCQLADPASGILWTNAADLAYRTGCSREVAQKYLTRLTRKGYIKRFPVPRSRKHYPILVHGFECTLLPHKGKRLNAEETKDWRVPVYTSGMQSGTQSGKQIGTQKPRRSSSL